jgi:hypothetical protein
LVAFDQLAALHQLQEFIDRYLAHARGRTASVACLSRLMRRKHPSAVD